MSHFYGTMAAGRKPVTKRGHKSTGLFTKAASWFGAVTVDLYVNDKGEDYAKVRLTPHEGEGADLLLYDGPVDGPNAGEDGRWRSELVRYFDDSAFDGRFPFKRMAVAE